MRRILVVCAVVAELLFGSAFYVNAAPAVGTAVAPAQQANWTSYEGGARHPSFTTNAQISKAAAAHLKLAWSWKPDPPTLADQPRSGFFSSPTVYNHRIYVGAYTGVFYALDETTGKVLWSRFLGYQPSRTLHAAPRVRLDRRRDAGPERDTHRDAAGGLCGGARRLHVFAGRHDGGDQVAEFDREAVDDRQRRLQLVLADHRGRPGLHRVRLEL